MITYCDEQLAFLRAIIDEPDDDVRRLAYADWLDEHDQPERAELIRLQCELAKSGPQRKVLHGESVAVRRGDVFFHVYGTENVVRAEVGERVDVVNVNAPNKQRKLLPGILITEGGLHTSNFVGKIDANSVEDAAAPLLVRERHLLFSHASRWRKGPVCKKCIDGKIRLLISSEGHGKSGKSLISEKICTHCHGIGDAGGLMRKMSYEVVNAGGGNDGSPYFHQVNYIRGMKRIHVTLTECTKFRLNHDNGVPLPGIHYEPSDWLRSVLTHHPDVVEVWVTDYPSVLHAIGRWGFTTTDLLSMPAEIVRLMDEDQFDTADIARTALARTVVRWGRKFL